MSTMESVLALPVGSLLSSQPEQSDKSTDLPLRAEISINLPTAFHAPVPSRDIYHAAFFLF